MLAVAEDFKETHAAAVEEDKLILCQGHRWVGAQTARWITSSTLELHELYGHLLSSNIAMEGGITEGVTAMADPLLRALFVKRLRVSEGIQAIDQLAALEALQDLAETRCWVNVCGICDEAKLPLRCTKSLHQVDQWVRDIYLDLCRNQAYLTLGERLQELKFIWIEGGGFLPRRPTPTVPTQVYVPSRHFEVDPTVDVHFAFLPRDVSEEDREACSGLLLAMGLPSMDALVERNVVEITGMRRHNPSIFSDVLKHITPLYLEPFAPEVHAVAERAGLFARLAEAEVRRVETLTETIAFTNGMSSHVMSRNVYWDLNKRVGESNCFYVLAKLPNDEQFQAGGPCWPWP
jgi:hypothetical protein